ncbi:MAG: hypothetical protein ACFBSD_11555 [Paracoccaceae bacterium]
MLKSEDLLRTAERLVEQGRGKPREADLRRAISTAYYAVFHVLARDCADLLVGGRGANRSLPAWQQAYRALDHAQVKQMCAKSTFGDFSEAIKVFGNAFVTLQLQRHKADYDPLFSGATLSNATKAIAQARHSIEAYRKAPKSDRRAFCIFVTLKLRV